MRISVLAMSLLAVCHVGFVHGQEPTAQVTERLPEHLAYLYDLEQGADNVQRQLFAAQRLWAAGDTLKVCFFNGDEVVAALIDGVASEWEKHASIKLDFGEVGARRNCTLASAGFNQIRIAFGEMAYWSTVGRDSINLLNFHQPSMNLGGFDLKYSRFQAAPDGTRFTVQNVVELSDRRDRATILHEFGHALGLLHEHQNPRLGCENEIRWEGPGNVFEYYAGPYNYWSRETVLRNLGPIARIDPDFMAGEPDRESIMIYAQPASIFLRGEASPCFVLEPFVLSTLDKEGIAKMYPSGTVTLTDSGFTTNSPVLGLAIPPPSGPIQSADRIARITADLGSDVVSVRREARRQLALELEQSSGAALTELVAEAAARDDYRHQLGVLVAIDKAQAVPVLDPNQAEGVAAGLDAIRNRTNDETLRDAVTSAQIKIGIQ